MSNQNPMLAQVLRLSPVIPVLVIERTDGGLARATFAELCETALGPQDYLAIAERFHTLFLEDVPILSSRQARSPRQSNGTPPPVRAPSLRSHPA